MKMKKLPVGTSNLSHQSVLYPGSGKIAGCTASGPFNQIGTEAPGTDIHRFRGTAIHDPDTVDIRLLLGQGPSGNLGTGYADLSAKKHVFLTNITLRHFVNLLASCY